MPSPSVFWSARTAVSTCRTSFSPGFRFALFSATLSQNPSGRPRYIYHSSAPPHPPRAPSRCRDLSLSARSFFSPSFVMSSARSLPECWGHRGVCYGSRIPPVLLLDRRPTRNRPPPASPRTRSQASKPPSATAPRALRAVFASRVPVARVESVTPVSRRPCLCR